MSQASCQRTIHLIKKAGSLTPFLVCTWGDLYQDYKPNGSGGYTATPDFGAMAAADRPVVSFIVTNSNGSAVDVTGIVLRFGGVAITFNSSTNLSTTTGYAGLFRRIAPADNGGNWGVRIEGSIAEAAGWASTTIEIVGTINMGDSTTTLAASLPVSISQVTSDAYHVTIGEALRPDPDHAGQYLPPTNFTLESETDESLLKAIVRLGNQAITSGLSYQWQKLDLSQAEPWVDIPSAQGGTAQTLSVGVGMIDSYACFRVVVSKGGAEIGSDIQGVWDGTDPYYIDANPTPEDETIEQGNASRASVAYAPVLRHSDGTAVSSHDGKFCFALLDSAGTPVNTDDQTPQASFTVQGAQIEQIGGDAVVIISTTIGS